MAARRRHSVAGAEKTARIFFGAAGEPQSIPQHALLYFIAGMPHKTYSASQADLKWYVKCAFEIARYPWPLAWQGTELERAHEGHRVLESISTLRGRS
jgi:hypothetical protein